MSESRKFYNRGVKNFHNGDLEKAIANLDIAISHDMKNSAALNLRGIIYYIKGQTEKAIASWQINVDFNDDSIAQGHIDSFEQDEVNIHRYGEALKLMKKGDFLGTIEILELAAYSDFNFMNVRNALAFCYTKEMDYDKAKNNIDLVLEKDRNNIVAKEQRQVIKKDTGLYTGMGKKKIIALVAFIAVVLVGGMSFRDNPKKISTDDKENIASLVVDKNEENKEKDKSSDDLEEDIVTTNNKTIDIDKVNNALKNKNFTMLGESLLEADIEGLSELELSVVKEAKALMATEGMQYFYKSGTSEFNAKNFGEAKDMFLKALDYSKGTYLDAHITYMLSVTCETLGDNKEAIKYYEKYESTDYEEKGSYTEEVLYKLAILNEKEGNSNSKEFANKLVSEYPSSIYNNDNIKAILNN